MGFGNFNECVHIWQILKISSRVIKIIQAARFYLPLRNLDIFKEGFSKYLQFFRKTSIIHDANDAGTLDILQNIKIYPLNDCN